MVLRQAVRRNRLHDVFLRLMGFTRRHKSTGNTIEIRTGTIQITGSLIQLIPAIERLGGFIVFTHPEIGGAEKRIDIAFGQIVHFSKAFLRTCAEIRSSTVVALGVIVFGDIVIDIHVHRIHVRFSREYNRFVNIPHLKKVCKEIISQGKSVVPILHLDIPLSILLYTSAIRRLRQGKQTYKKQTKDNNAARAIHNDNQAISKNGAKIQHFFDISIIIIQEKFIIL